MATRLGSEQKRSKYRLLGLVGQGQFGRVFCAAHRRTGQLVALKDLDRDRFPTAQFLRELRFLLSLQHPNIVTFQAVEHTATGRYLVMDYCEGGTLRSLMAEEGRLSLSQSLRLVIGILAGLEHAHAQQIIHCDIKPENVLLNVTPTGWTARISDFGIARLVQELDDPGLSNTGSPAYMAPERFYGQYSPTSDLYSVGILMYELLTGHRPFSGTPADLMTAHLNHPVTFPETVPDVLQPIISTALQKLSARRFRSAQEMRDVILRTAHAAHWLDSETDPSPLLKPVTLPCSTAFHPQCQEKLRFQKTALGATELGATIDQPQLYLFRSGGQQVTLQTWEKQDRSSTTYSPHPELWHLAPLPSPIVQLVPRPQGCFVIAEKSLHLICPDGRRFSLTPQLIAELPPFSQVAIEAKGRWFAVLMPSEIGHLLRFYRLPQMAASMKIAPDSLQVSLPAQATSAARMLALDAHHVAIVTEIGAGSEDNQSSPIVPPIPDEGTAKEERLRLAQRNKSFDAGTEVQIFSRRGQRTGALTLPFRLSNLLVTPIPYRLLAVDRDNPCTVVLIDLKPLRIRRIGVEITPTFLAAALWGFLLANREGQIVLLDAEGRKVGCLVAPEPITAMNALEQHQLTIATWNGSQGSLYTVNLKEADVDLIF